MDIISPEPAHSSKQALNPIIEQAVPFSQDWVTLSKEEYINLTQQANYWKAQHAQLKQKNTKLEDEIQYLKAKVKDLQNRVFGKKSEKKGLAKSEKNSTTPSKNNRGQQPGSKGHGRTPRPDLPVILQTLDLKDEDKNCHDCGLPHIPTPALNECSDYIEVEVQAYTRRVSRPAYVRNPGCQCENTPVVITAPPLPRLIPGSPYQVSFWVEVLLSKYHYSQPTHRYLEDLNDQALPVSPGTVAGGLQKLLPLFEPVMDELYEKQMTESLFHNDETRWEVFVEMEGKVGTRWYLWVTRSESVIYFILDPSRSAAVPQEHFAGLQQDKVILVVDRYSSYKKLARLSDIILLAFCWAHVRRDFLDAGRKYKELELWAMAWKERIGTLYHHNRLRLEHWNAEETIEQQSEAFTQHHQSVENILSKMKDEATSLTGEDDSLLDEATQALSRSARTQQRKVCQSLLNHREGLTLFVENPQVPLDNNIAENTIRGPVTGRKNYYGSGSLWSALLAATLFSILKTLVLWNINPRHWITDYLTACAENGGLPPEDLSPFIPWKMTEARRKELSRPPPRINDTS
jgi:transposase